MLYDLILFCHAKVNRTDSVTNFIDKGEQVRVLYSDKLSQLVYFLLALSYLLTHFPVFERSPNLHHLMRLFLCH